MIETIGKSITSIYTASESCWPPGTRIICTDVKFNTLEGMLDVISGLLSGAIALSGLVAVILLVYSGYNYILSAGDPDKVATANKTITNTIIGMIIILLTGLIIKFVLDVIIDPSTVGS